MRKGPGGHTALVERVGQRQPALPRLSAGQELTVGFPTPPEQAPPVCLPSHSGAPVGKCVSQSPSFTGHLSKVNDLHFNTARRIPRLSGICWLAEQSKAMGRLPGDGMSTQDSDHSDTPGKMRHDHQVFRRALPLPPYHHHTKSPIWGESKGYRELRSGILIHNLKRS